jgi:hypothetical protein
MDTQNLPKYKAWLKMLLRIPTDEQLETLLGGSYNVLNVGRFIHQNGYRAPIERKWTHVRPRANLYHLVKRSDDTTSI